MSSYQVSRGARIRRLARVAAAALILGGGLSPALAQQDWGAGPTAPGGQPQARPAPQRQAPTQAPAPQQGGDFGGRDYRGAPQPQAAPAPGPRGGSPGQPQPRVDQGPRGGYGGGGYGGGGYGGGGYGGGGYGGGGYGGGGGYRGGYDGGYDRRFGRRDYDDYDRPRGYGYGAPRAQNFGRVCVTSRGQCGTRPGPVGAGCGCEIPGFGFKRGAIGY